MAWGWRLLVAAVLLLGPGGYAATSASPQQSRFAIVTIATDDYYAKGALVTLHSAGLHAQQPGSGSSDVDRVLMVPSAAGPSRLWRERFRALGVIVVGVPEVSPSKAIHSAMERDRQQLAQEGILEVLQPVPYGGAFAKIHAWDPKLFGQYDKVLLLDGDVLVKRDLRGLLKLEPLAASKDLVDAFNYGVLLLRPDGKIHAELLNLLSRGTEAQLARYNTRKPSEAGLCDQTLVAGFLSEHYGPVHFFEDLQKASRKQPRKWLLSTEYNLVVSYRAKDRCDDSKERARVEAARIVHFANNWLNFEVLARDREAPGRVDSPRCYKDAFRYWHDIYHHGLAVADLATGDEDVMEKPPRPTYTSSDQGDDDDGGLASPEQVKEVFLEFQRARAAAAAPARTALEL